MSTDYWERQRAVARALKRCEQRQRLLEDRALFWAQEEHRWKTTQFEGDPVIQRVLFAGLDACPGQLNLFETDGEEPHA